jgi:hypothetical protein
MTTVYLGNANALEASNDPQSGEMVYSQIPGERVTTFVIPDSVVGEMAIVQTVLAGLPRMISPDARPWWVECDNGAVQDMLLAHFGLPPQCGQRPVTWGDGTTSTAVEEKKPKKGAKA